MPRKTKSVASPTAVLPKIAAELLDQIVTGPMTQDGVEEVMRGFKKALIERVLGAEMSHHLGYSPGATKLSATGINRPVGSRRNPATRGVTRSLAESA